MATIYMLSPIGNKSFACSSGNVYTADNLGLIEDVVSSADISSLSAMGCALLSPNTTNLLGSLKSADFNTTDDQTISINNASRFRITKISVIAASVSMTTAQGGIYTGASKSGTTIVSASQAYTSLTSSTVILDLTLASTTLLLPSATPLYLSLTTAQGATATADIYVWGDVYE